MITPWGKSDNRKILIKGITIVDTPFHGGMKVNKKYNKKIPSVFRNVNGWYEEDCEMNIPLYFLYDLLKKDINPSKEKILNSIEQWFPGKYQVYTQKEPEIATEKEIKKAKEHQNHVECLDKLKKGDVVIFRRPIYFNELQSYQKLMFVGRNDFLTDEGTRCKISNWKKHYPIKEIVKKDNTLEKKY